MSQAKLIIQHGIPGSGKSTETAEYVHNHPHENIVVINRDTIRTKLFGKEYLSHTPDKKSEAQVTIIQQKLMRDTLSQGKTVIDDNTNLNRHVIASAVKIAKEYNAEIIQQHFDVPFETCLERNEYRRVQGGHYVPYHVMESMMNKAYDNGHLKEYIIHDNGQVSIVSNHSSGRLLLNQYNENLKNSNPFRGKAAVLIDVDGTLANNAHESSWYLNRAKPSKDRSYGKFYQSIETSPVNTYVRDAANNLRNNNDLNLIILTGREDSYAKELLSFINRSSIEASMVVAKRAGDMRPDGEFKKFIIKNLQNDGHIIVHAFDDRESSIATMEHFNIPVSRVDTPSFNMKEIAASGIKPEPAIMPQVNYAYPPGYCIRCGSKLKDSSKNIGKRCATRM